MKNKKAIFIAQLAEFLAGNQGLKSIQLQVERLQNRPGLAHEWEKLRSESCLRGYPTMAEAISQLTDLLE